MFIDKSQKIIGNPHLDRSFGIGITIDIHRIRNTFATFSYELFARVETEPIHHLMSFFVIFCLMQILTYDVMKRENQIFFEFFVSVFINLKHPIKELDLKI